MWAFTRDGFFSVVHNEYCGSDELMVRARCRADLERLKKKVKTISDVATGGDDTYLFRMVVDRDQWAKYLQEETHRIDYSHFRDDTVEDGDDDRILAYFMAWGSLYQWQQKEAIASGDWQNFPVFESGSQ